MTCSAFEYAKNGRRGIGVNQPQAGLHYPFVEPAPEVQYLIADFYLAYEDLNSAYQHPFKLKWVYGLGCESSTAVKAPAHAADVLVVDANDVTVFDSTIGCEFASWGWGSKHPLADPAALYDYQVYEWISANVVCRLVSYNTWPIITESAGADDDAPRNYPTHISLTSGTLDERSVYRLPRRVNSVKVKNGVTTSAAITGDIDLHYGYNTELTAQPQQRRGIRATNQIQINAVPGAGLGKYLNCPETGSPIYAINGMTGPDILIEASDCVWLKRPAQLVGDKLVLTSPSSSSSSAGSCICPPASSTATLAIVSNCPACCQCSDYVQVGNYMNRTADRYRPIGQAANTIVALHQSNIDRWLEQQDCRLQRPLQACLAPQRCPYVDVVVQFCNQCTECAQDVVLNMTFETLDLQNNVITNTATTVCGYTNITTPSSIRRLETITGTWPNLSANIGKVDIGNSAQAQFRLQFSQSVPTNIRMVLTGTTGAGDIKAGCNSTDPPASAVVIESLYCANDGTTSVTCAEGAQAIKLLPNTP
jgi:hypothetical protein